MSQSVHRAGINIRHLGLVRSKASKSQLRKELLQEMIARVMKGQLFPNSFELDLS